jgi:hypothetical protein
MKDCQYGEFKSDQMGEACSTNWENEKGFLGNLRICHIEDLGVNGKRLFERTLEN